MEQFINHARLVHFCESVANKVEQEIQAFDEHRTFDEERERVFRLGILHAVTKLGYAFRNNETVTIDTDYEKFIKKYEMYHGLKEVRAEEKAHQISMEEYIASQNKSAQDSKTASDNLAEKVAETVILYLDKLLKKVDKKPKKDK